MEKMQHFSIRKLSIGAASVLIGISFLGVKVSTVKADSLQNASATELTKSKAANEAIEQDISSNIEQKPTSDIKKDTSSNIEQDTGSNIKQETASKADTKQITNDHPNTAQTPVKPASPKPNSNQQNAVDLEAKPQVPAKIKLQANSVITPNKADHTEVEPTTLMAIAGKKLSPNLLAESKVMTPAKDTNGGFDEATWGKLDVNKWKGNVQGDYYQLTDYTGDANHVIVPNEADFVKAGISTSGKQVGVTSDLMHTIFRDKTTAQDATVAFSKTDNKQVKTIGTDWHNTWGHANDHVNGSWIHAKGELTKFDGSNLDVSNVTNMSKMFEDNQISDLSPLSNWNVSNVIDMGHMFGSNHISDLSPLSNWNVSNVIDMGHMFGSNHISDLSPLSNWKVDQVTDMGYMFSINHISDLSPLSNWKVKVANVTDMSNMFYKNHISDLSPLAGWKVDHVTDMRYMFYGNQISDLSPLANWKTGNVININDMFGYNHISDLSPLAGWKTDNVTDISNMFEQNHISDLSPLAGWKVDHVTDMRYMFYGNQISDLSPLAGWHTDNVTDMSWMFGLNPISDLSPLAGWKVDHVTDMHNMFQDNQISDLSPLASWKTDKVTDMRDMFFHNRISDLSPLANWNVNNVTNMNNMFDNNVTNQTKNLQAKRVINFVYPDGYTGKKQDTITQTENVPQKVNVTLTTNAPKPSNNILDWVTKTETPISKITDPAYFQDYTVPAIKGLLEPDQTVIKGQQADITKPINVTITYKLADSNTNDAFALDSKNGLHEHANVNDNGGYDEDYWGKIDVDDWNYTVSGDRIEINSLKDGVSTGTNDTVIVPNLDDFKLAGKDNDAKTVYISSNALGKTAKHKYYGLSKTNGNTFATDSALSWVFYKNSNLTHADLNSLNTSNATNMHWMFEGASSLKSLDVSNWDTRNVTDMSGMFNGASGLTSLDVSNWKTGKVTNMSLMFNGASGLTSLDVSNWKTGKVTNMSLMFHNANSLTSLDVSNWDTSNVTDMLWMFNNNPKLALIVNGDKFADYLINHDSFAESNVDLSVKSVTTDNPKLLKLLTNDSQHNSAIRTITLMLPVGYNPDLVKYHLIKVGNTYQIKQSADYDKSYLQGTVLINATNNIDDHHIDATKPNKLTDTWQPNYNKLVLAHKNSDGSVSFDAIQLPKVPGYKAAVKTVANPINPSSALFAVSFMVLPKPATSVPNDTKPAETVSPATPVAIEVAKPIKTEPKVTISATPNAIDLSNDAVTATPDVSTWQVANEPDQDTYHVSNGQYAVELPHISNAQLHVIANDSTKDTVLFTYKGQNNKYVFKIKFVDGHYLLTTYKIKSGKLVKLIDYNFVKSSKMIDVILDWIKLK